MNNLSNFLKNCFHKYHFGLKIGTTIVWASFYLWAWTKFWLWSNIICLMQLDWLNKFVECVWPYLDKVHVYFHSLTCNFQLDHMTILPSSQAIYKTVKQIADSWANSKLQNWISGLRTANFGWPASNFSRFSYSFFCNLLSLIILAKEECFLS